MKYLLALLALLVTLPTFAQSQRPDAEFERVLVPVFFFGEGANGSQWTTSVNVFNTGEQFGMAVPTLEGSLLCRALCGCSIEKDVRERVAMRVCPAFADPTGLLLWIPRNADTSELNLQARVRDLSQQADSAGTDVPVIRESDLLGHRMVLQDVPTDSRFRVSLRLFDAYQWGGSVRLRAYDAEALRRGEAPAPLVDAYVEVRDSVVYIQDERFPLRPAFASIGDLAAAYPQIRAASSVVIDLETFDPPVSPPAPTNRSYALASVTNNITQEVTVIKPR